MPRQEIFEKFEKGTLRSSSGQKVTNRKQAIAIAMSYSGAEHAMSKHHGKKKRRKK